MKDVEVDDLYDGYELSFIEEDESVEVFCNRCEKTIGEMNMNEIKQSEEAGLYGKIVSLHREVGVE